MVKPIYQQIWQEAKPYYLKARPMDVAHIEWFMEVASRACEIEKLDDTLLLPLAILHDIGYSTVGLNDQTNYYQLDIRKAHMLAGSDLARKILSDLQYPSDKIDRICYYISVHDNWAFGEVDLFVNDPILGVFKDLDYLWIFTEIGCKAIQPILKLDNSAMLKHLENEPSPIGGKKPYSIHFTQQLHDQYLAERTKELL